MHTSYVNENDIQRKAIGLVVDERQKQTLQHGVQHHAPPIWALILGEEVGELNEAILETYLKGHHPERGGYTNMLTEATHVAAVALQFLEYLLREPESCFGE